MTDLTEIVVDKAGYTATKVARGWAGAVIKKSNQAFEQEQ